jgi:myo-inositol-1(or 4)-monophosphatase
VRSHGSAALELCWVAAGRCDGYYEDELARWDWAAGALVAREAGATVSALGRGVLATSPTLHDELLTLVAAGP